MTFLGSFPLVFTEFDNSLAPFRHLAFRWVISLDFMFDMSKEKARYCLSMIRWVTLLSLQELVVEIVRQCHMAQGALRLAALPLCVCTTSTYAAMGGGSSPCKQCKSGAGLRSVTLTSSCC